jgi:hypothetical protein
MEFNDREANIALLESLAFRRPAGGEPGLLVPYEPWASDILVGDGGILFRTQFQAEF